jgi:hypothetical protein
VVPPTSARKCNVQWTPLPGTACDNVELAETHPGGRAAHTLVARKRSMYIFGGYGGDKVTYGHPYVLRYLPNLDSPEDLAPPLTRRVSPKERTPPAPRPPARRVAPRERTPPESLAAGGGEGAGWRSSKRARLREAVLAAAAPVASVVGDSQAGGGEEEQRSPHNGADVGDEGEGRKGGERRGAVQEKGGPAGKKRKVAEEKHAAGRREKEAAAEGVARKVNGGGRGGARAGRRGGADSSSSRGQEEESPVQADVTETQSAADRGGRAGATRQGWQAPRGRAREGRRSDGGGVGHNREEQEGTEAAEAFSFPCNSQKESPRGPRRGKRKARGREEEAPPKDRAEKSKAAKGALPVEKSTGLADFEREHYAAAVTKVEREKEALEGLLQNKVEAVAHLTAEKRGLVGEREGLAQQVVEAEQRWAAARDAALRHKEARSALQNELEEAKR